MIPQNIADPNLPVNEISRDFKGIWIPREIWLDSRLLPLEKILWAELHSLFDRTKKGCFASNQFLSNRLGVKERHLQSMLANLKKFGLLMQVSFDGRQRVLRALMPPEDLEIEQLNNIAGQGCILARGRGALDRTPTLSSTAPPSYIEKKDENTVENTLTQSACAGGGDSQISEKIDEAKPKAKPEFSEEVKALAEQMDQVLKEGCPVYIPQSKSRPFLDSVRRLLESDKQTPSNVLKTLRWAVSDKIQRGDFNGWSSVIYKKNPAEKLRQHFPALWQQMQSKPQGKVDRRLRDKDGNTCDDWKDNLF